ncbi:MAG: hypothetical protein K0S07_749 [Chlamydiales bacterium]|jgi:hypothetical protein|nr:hypothetical protein [Chlamydiales bacterium]
MDISSFYRKENKGFEEESIPRVLGCSPLKGEAHFKRQPPFKKKADLDLRKLKRIEEIREKIGRSISERIWLKEKMMVKLIKEGFFEGKRPWIKACLKANGSFLKLFKKDVRHDLELVQIAVEAAPFSIQYAGEALKKNPLLASIAARQEPMTLSLVDPFLLKEDAFMKELIAYNGLALEFAPHLADDESVAFQAVSQNGYALAHVSERLKNQERIVLQAVKERGKAIRFASQEMQNKEKIVKAAVEKEPMALKFCGRKWQNDKTLVSALLRKDPRVFLFAGEELRHKLSFVLELLEEEIDVIHYAPREMELNPFVVHFDRGV